MRARRHVHQVIQTVNDQSGRQCRRLKGVRMSMDGWGGVGRVDLYLYV
jgi:hypothetical protein